MISRNTLASGFWWLSLHVPGVQSLVAEQRKLSGEELKFRAATGGLAPLRFKSRTEVSA